MAEGPGGASTEAQLGKDFREMATYTWFGAMQTILTGESARDAAGFYSLMVPVLSIAKRDLVVKAFLEKGIFRVSGSLFSAS